MIVATVYLLFRTCVFHIFVISYKLYLHFVMNFVFLCNIVVMWNNETLKE